MNGSLFGRLLVALTGVTALLAIGCSSGVSRGDAGGDASAAACHEMCVKTTALNCSNAPTETACEQGCNNPPMNPGCESQQTAFYRCVKNASTYACDSYGQPQAVGCDRERSTVMACFVDGGSASH